MVEDENLPKFGLIYNRKFDIYKNKKTNGFNKFFNFFITNERQTTAVKFQIYFNLHCN